MRRRHGSFTGGIDLADEKHATLNAPIQVLPPPKRLFLPLTWDGRRAADCVVSAGQTVARGQVVARGDGLESVDIHAPLAGRVSRIGQASVAGRDEFLTVRAIELTELRAPGPGESADPVESAKPAWDWREADGQEIRRRLSQSPLMTYRRGGESLRSWLEQARAGKCRTLIANCMEGEPYVASDHRLLVERGSEVVGGLAMLARALEVKETMLVVDHRRTGAYRDVIGPCRLHQVQPVALSHKYPTCIDAMLIKILLGRELPPGLTPLDIGIGVVQAACCQAAYRQAACSQTPLGRVVTVGGDRAVPHGQDARATGGNFFVPFGANCMELAGDSDGVVTHGGPMSGLLCRTDSVVGPQTDAVLVLSSADIAPPGPCIRCGWCTDYCPARLNVAALNDMYELGRIEQSAKAGVSACVQCGICSYVCPARLPLTPRVVRLKQAVRQVAAVREGPS